MIDMDILICMQREELKRHRGVERSGATQQRPWLADLRFDLLGFRVLRRKSWKVLELRILIL